MCQKLMLSHTKPNEYLLATVQSNGYSVQRKLCLHRKSVCLDSKLGERIRPSSGVSQKSCRDFSQVLDDYS